jgi:hypothetical protein
MSRPNVEIIRRFNALVNAGDGVAAAELVHARRRP